jgi:hypothetical protein
MEDKEERIRDKLFDSYLAIKKEDPFMFNNIDSFVALSRDNASVYTVELFPFDSDARIKWVKWWEISGSSR